MTLRTLDLTVSDVHVDGVGGDAPPVGKKKMGKLRVKKKLATAQPKPTRGVRIRAHLGVGGQLHVRHMEDSRGALALLSGLELDAVELDASGTEDGNKPVWIQIAKPGAFKGHGAGAFTLDAAVFDQIVANFNATANRRIAIDFNHASEQDPADGTIGTHGTPAQGWILDMKVKGGNLWGLVEWGSLARQYIRDGGYKFFSPAIRFNSRDRVTGLPVGARMSSGALTNDPFLDGMMPVAASAAMATERQRAVSVLLQQFAAGTDETLPAIRRALRLSELASPTECAEQFARLLEAFEEGDGADVHGIPVGACIAALRAEMCVPLTTKIEDLFSAVEEILDEAQGLTEPDDDADDTNPPSTDSSGAPVAALDQDEDMTMANTDDTAKLLSAQAQISETTLKLSAATAELAAAKTTIAEQDARIVTLSAEQTKREALELAAEVDAAILTWGTRKGISDKDREHLLNVRTSNPAAFRAFYPEENPVQARLLSRVTPPAPRQAPPAGEELSVEAGEAFCVTLSRVQKAHPQLSTKGAYEKAFQIRNHA